MYNKIDSNVDIFKLNGKQTGGGPIIGLVFLIVSIVVIVTGATIATIIIKNTRHRNPLNGQMENTQADINQTLSISVFNRTANKVKIKYLLQDDLSPMANNQCTPKPPEKQESSPQCKIEQIENLQGLGELTMAPNENYAAKIYYWTQKKCSGSGNNYEYTNISLIQNVLYKNEMFFGAPVSEMNEVDQSKITARLIQIHDDTIWVKLGWTEKVMKDKTAQIFELMKDSSGSYNIVSEENKGLCSEKYHDCLVVSSSKASDNSGQFNIDIIPYK